MNLCRSVIGNQVRASGVAPTPKEGGAEQQYVEPVDQKLNAVVDELGEQRGGKRRERDGAEKSDMNPGEIAVGAIEVVELGLLADPEDTKRHHAHQKNHQPRREGKQDVP